MSAEQLEMFPFGDPGAIELPQRPSLTSSSTLQDALAPFQVYMADKQLTGHTVNAFTHDLGLLSEFLGAETGLAQCSTHRLEEFLHYLQHGRKAPCSPKSLERRITTLKVFFGWLAAQNVLATDPAAPLVHERPGSPLPQILSPGEVEALLAVTADLRDAAEAPDARPHLLVSLVLGTGIKKAECMGIALTHIDLSNPEQPSVYIHYERPRQRLKARLLALPADFPATLEAYLRRYQPRERLFECTPRNLEYVLHNVTALAGLRQPLTFEMLRWTCAVRCHREGMAEDRLRRRLGLSPMAWRQTLPIIEALAEGPL